VTTPTAKWLGKAVGVGLYGFLVALSAARASGVDLGASQLEDAAIAGGIGLLSFLGLAGTPLENPNGG
jgi:hypothetical protein